MAEHIRVELVEQPLLVLPEAVLVVRHWVMGMQVHRPQAVLMAVVVGALVVLVLTAVILAVAVGQGVLGLTLVVALGAEPTLW